MRLDSTSEDDPIRLCGFEHGAPPEERGPRLWLQVAQAVGEPAGLHS